VLTSFSPPLETAIEFGFPLQRSR